jgi:2'-5' RNA ligase
MRLFIGIPLAGAVIDELTALTRRLKAGADTLRWAAPETWHITLQFLGNTTPEQYSCLVPALRRLHLPRTPVVIDELGIFDRAGVFFAGMKAAPEMLAIYDGVVAATTPCGFAAEIRPFHPHITLARSKGDGRAAKLRELKAKISQHPRFTKFIASEYLLYEAFLSPTGSRYEVSERFPLKSA